MSSAGIIGGAVVILGGAAVLYAVLSGEASGPDAQPPTIPAITPTANEQGLAKAIAFAEGFWDVNSNPLSSSIPYRANNPGDLVIPGWPGNTLGAGIAVLSSMADGWNRLYYQLALIVSGNSENFSLNDTILGMAETWTDTDPEDWAANVIYFANLNYGLSLTVNTPLSQVIP